MLTVTQQSWVSAMILLGQWSCWQWLSSGSKYEGNIGQLCRLLQLLVTALGHDRDQHDIDGTQLRREGLGTKIEGGSTAVQGDQDDN